MNGLQLDNGRISKVRYYKSSLEEDFNGKPAYVRVGHTDAFEIMKKNLKSSGEHWEEQREWEGEIK
ncbi:MAG: hypothetical protein L0J63_01105 [Tetragenococcus koreensis]|nr:hypothetical protein [Tetragenococcus koreensis]